MIGGKVFTDRTTLIKGGYVLTLDPALGDMPNSDVLIDGEKIAAVGPEPERGPARQRHRRAEPDRHAGLRGHAPAHVADAGSRRPAELHAGRVFRGHAEQHRHPVPRRGCVHREPDGRARGRQRRHHDAARLVARQQHAGTLRRRRRRPDRGGHPRDLRARRAGRPRLVGVQLARASRRHPPHPEDVLPVRRSAADARDGSPRTRQHDA